MAPTFAMLGSEECPGVVSLMPSKLDQRVDKLRSEGQKCDVTVTYLEVYNKVVRDLQCLDLAKGIDILYLTIQKVKEAGILLEPLLKGNKNRTQNATDANAESAWSHAILQSYVKLWPVGTQMFRMREGTKLNLSLLALGNCIDARSKKGTQQVPYQDSQHTHILKDSLGGSGSAFMIGTVTAVNLSYVETYTTLEYALSILQGAH
ncbi:kinesin-like protein KIF18B [Dermacentor silvarum]|uniref:kinesin-like protein KIF18B n=1 Tax=Dermacentor silvarum TaxID=543639 RepID=UPI00189AC796|nr:kinesin-like protein KIF18B [Dermacentor silvarum]